MLAFKIVTNYGAFFTTVMEASDAITNCEALRVADSLVKHAIRTDPRLATSKSIIQLMTLDVNAERNDGSLLDAWFPAA